MAEELKPCPFCGNDAQVEQEEPELPTRARVTNQRRVVSSSL